MKNNYLKIAIQEKGRLSDKSVETLEQIGLEFDTYSRKLSARCQNFPIDILFVRDDDIPEYVGDGTVDLGIVGNDVILERQVKLKKIMPLNFGYCSLNIACPKKLQIQNIIDLNNLKIATTYPNILKKYFKKNKISAETVKLSGSVEIAPTLDVADCICDIISTGNTLKMNGLVPSFKVLDSQAYLIADLQSWQDVKKRKIIATLAMRIKSLIQARNTKYIMLNAPKSAVEKIIQIIPGADSPTVIPLVNNKMVAIHSVVHEDVFWEVIDKLKAAGAKSILISPIEKLII